MGHRECAARVLLHHQDRDPGGIDHPRSSRRSHRPPSVTSPADGSSSRSIVRLGHQRAREREHLPLAARERSRSLERRRSRAAGRARASRPGAGDRSPRGAQARPSSRFSATVIVGKTFWRWATYPTPSRHDRVRLAARDVLAAQENSARPGPQQPDHRLHERRLAGPVRTDDRHHLSSSHVTSDAVEDRDVSEVPGVDRRRRDTHRFPVSHRGLLVGRTRAEVCGR